jgi:hypothetical protein
MVLVWWHWLVIGFLLLGLELLFPSFPMIWFGLGAMVTGIFLVLFPGSPAWLQAVVWILISLCFTHLWRNYLRPQR